MGRSVGIGALARGNEKKQTLKVTLAAAARCDGLRSCPARQARQHALARRAAATPCAAARRRLCARRRGRVCVRERSLLKRETEHLV